MDFGKIGNNHGAYRSEASIADTNTAGKMAGNGLKELTPGKVFAGEVVSVGKDKVLLRLDNGQTIQAGVNGNVQLSEGQRLAFLVKSNTGKQLAIKPMFDVGIQNSSVLKALENAGIPVNSKSVELINLLMKEQMPIDKETITKFLRQMTLNPDTDVKTLVQLQKMGLPITEENIARFESYQNHEYRLSNEVTNVAADISRLIGENLTEQKNPLDVFGKIADIICTEQESIENVRADLRENLLEAVSEGKQTSSFQDGPVLYENLKSETLMHNNAENLTSIQKQALENIEAVTERFQGQESEIDHIVESLKSLNEEAQGVIRALEEKTRTETQSPQKQDMMTKLLAAFEMYETAEKSMKAAKTVMNTGEYDLPEQKQASGQNASDGKASLPETGLLGELDESGRIALAQKIQKAGGDVVLSLQIRNGEIKPEELVRTVRQLVQEVQQEMQQMGTSGQLKEKYTAVSELLQSREFQTVLKSTIEEQLLLKPEQLNKEKVKEYYEKLSQKMNQFTELINQLGKEDTSAMKNTTAVRQNVDYMNQLNQLYSYIQLPVKLATQNAHSELYVLTKKKRLGENGGAFTALLHLDMEVLGSMDVYITMEKKKVSARFYLQREDIARFLEENSEPLKKKLEEKGFLVKAEFEKKPEEKDMVEELAGGQSEEHIMNKYSFDIRT